MLEYLLCFGLGVLLSWLFTYVMSLGHAIGVLKQTQISCAALFVASEQGLQEILMLKYLAMQEADRSEQNIVAQKYIDQLNIDSIKKSIMRNYVTIFPNSYSHIMEYSTWEEMEQYINKTIQEGGKIS